MVVCSEGRPLNPARIHHTPFVRSQTKLEPSLFPPIDYSFQATTFPPLLSLLLLIISLMTSYFYFSPEVGETTQNLDCPPNKLPRLASVLAVITERWGEKHV